MPGMRRDCSAAFSAAQPSHDACNRWMGSPGSPALIPPEMRKTTSTGKPPIWAVPQKERHPRKGKCRFGCKTVLHRSSAPRGCKRSIAQDFREANRPTRGSQCQTLGSGILWTSLTWGFCLPPFHMEPVDVAGIGPGLDHHPFKGRVY